MFIHQSVKEFVSTIYRPVDKLTVHHEQFIIWEARTTVLENVFTSFKPKVFESQFGVGPSCSLTFS